MIRLSARAATRALFGIVIERLGDLFEPSLCEVYARLFSHVIARAIPDYDAAELLLRYRRCGRCGVLLAAKSGACSFFRA